MTDIRIKDGDIVKDSAGRFEKISGKDAMFQRALIHIQVKPGSFIYDRNLGCDSADINLSDEDAKDKLELVINEAFVNYSNTSAQVTEISDKVKVKITIDGESREEEVSIDGNVQ